KLDEPIWHTAKKASQFYLKFPNDKDQPRKQTEAQVAYDDKFLYVAFTCWDTSFTIIQSLKRDIGHIDNDGVGISLDPMNQHTTGFIFVVNAYNAQSEDQISYNQFEELQWNWNNKWFSATQRYGDRWTAEMAIPFKTLRYPPGEKTWGINFIRVDMKNNQYSVWAQVPVNFRIYNLGYTGSLVWDAPPPVPGKNIVFIPYLTGSGQQDPENGEKTSGKLNAGLDAKLTLTSSLNLDLTMNPDFSQVEVDRQVTNLTRFNIFFPERRSFFLENSDIIGDYGIQGIIQPFYSRRIGLDNNGNRIPILGGARLSGGISSTTRIGLMSIQTGSKDDFQAQNYSAFSIHQNVFGRSVLKAYVFNRQSFPGKSNKSKADPLEAYGRNAGLTFDFSNKTGKWTAWAAFHQSMKPGITQENTYTETGMSYNGSQFTHIIDLVSIGTQYYTDMGFIQRIENYDALRDTTIRVGFKHIYDEINLKWFPLAGPISQHVLEFQNYIVFNPDYSFNEGNHELTYRLETKRNASYRANITHNEVRLLYPISFTDKTPLPATDYQYDQAGLEYSSDTRKKISLSTKARYGTFYNGKLTSLSGGITLRLRPHVNIELLCEYNRLNFPGEYGSTSLLLFSPRFEINFSTKTFWTTFLQYNTQRNNFNINSRFQYRFKPMSDLFVVYTDNYFTDPLFKNKNRALVFKLNYWLNL
ncbi:MAG: DUF5916 domain-containing protein, partial [Chitinophagaceae bacterium]